MNEANRHPEPDAFHDLVRRHHRRVYAAARRILRHDADAEDVTQQVFLRVLENDPDDAAPAGQERRLVWLASRLALNQLRSARRRHGIEQEYAMTKDRESGDHAVEGNEAARAVRREIAALPESQRLSLVLYYQQGLTLADAAGLLACAESTVHARIRAALERLRRRLRELGFAVAPASLQQLVEADGEVPVPDALEGRLLELAGTEAAAVAVSGKAWLLAAALFTGLVTVPFLFPPNSPLGTSAAGAVGLPVTTPRRADTPPQTAALVRERLVQPATPTVAAAGRDDSASPPKPVRIQVVDAAGNAVAGAGVEVLADYRSILTGRTDRQGQAELSIPAAARVQWILALRDGVGFDYFENYTVPMRIARPIEELPATVKLVLDGARRVVLHAKGPGGRALPGVGFTPWMLRRPEKTSYINLSGSELAQARSDAQGAVQFRWLPTRLMVDRSPNTGLCVVDERYDWPDQPAGLLDPGADREVAAVLVARLPIAGRVVDDQGRGVAGARVVAEGRGEPGGEFCRSAAVSDASGAFTVQLAPGQQYMVLALSGPRAAPVVHFALTDQGLSRPLRLELAATTRLHGRLLRKGSEEPVAGARVVLAARNPALQGSAPERGRSEYPEVGQVRETTTDAQGVYEFRVTDGDYFLVASGSSEAGFHSPATVTVRGETGLRRDLTWETAAQPALFREFAPLKVRRAGTQDYTFWLQTATGWQPKNSLCTQCHLPR